MSPFWVFRYTSWGIHVGHVGTRLWFNFSDRNIDPYLAPEIETPPRAIGRFFLNYAYSTPQGVAYCLVYGVNPCEE
jgi:hypothetical protein